MPTEVLKLNTYTIAYAIDEKQSPEFVKSLIQDFHNTSPSTDTIEIINPEKVCPVCSLKTLSSDDIYSCKICTNNSNRYYYKGMCLKCTNIELIHYRNLFCTGCTSKFRYTKCTKCKKLGYILSENTLDNDPAKLGFCKSSVLLNSRNINTQCIKCTKYTYKSIYRKSLL